MTSSTQKNPPVAILLGGKGTRLGLTDVPKPMVEFMGRPLLVRCVERLAAEGFTDLVFLTGYLSEVIETYFGDGSDFGVSIRYAVETEPLGTSRATRAAGPMLGDEFLLLYGDTVFDIDFARFTRQARANGGDVTLFVHPNDNPYDSDLVTCERGSTRIDKFLNKPHDPDLLVRNLVNAGLYYMTPRLFDAIPEGTDLFDWGRDVFPAAVASGMELHAYISTEYIKDVGTPDRIAKATRHVTSGLVEARSLRNKQRAVFIDRDGVINREIDGVYKPEDMTLLSDVADTLKDINQSPLISMLVTNQPDLAKGFFGFDDLERVHAEMEKQLSAGGAFIDDLFYCPHHPETGFEGEIPELKRACDCRKPAPGMLRDAANLHNIDLSASYMIGDRAGDLQAGRAVGATTFLVHRNQSNDLQLDVMNVMDLADHVVQDLASAWAIIKQDACS